MKQLLRLSVFLLVSALSFAQNNARMLSGVNVQTGSSYPLVAADATRLTVFTASGTNTATIPPPATTGFGSGSLFSIANGGAGSLVITCSCTIFANGGSGGSIVLTSGQGVDLYSSGSAYYAQGGSGSGSGGGSNFYQTIQANGTGLLQESILNLVQGTNITVNCADDAGGNRTTCTISGTGGGGSGPSIEVNGTPVGTQNVLNFLDFPFFGVTWQQVAGGGIQALLSPNSTFDTISDQPLIDSGTSTTTFAGCPSVTTSVQTGLQIHLIAGHTNAGSSTFNLCGTGALGIVKNGAAALVSTDIQAGGDASLQLIPGPVWQLLNPMSAAAGSVSGQQNGQITVGLTASTLTTLNDIFIAQAKSGTDLCAKINAALKSCPTGATAGCKVIVTPTVPGSIDVCSAATSDIWSGVGNFPTEIDLSCGTNIQLKGPINAPTAGFLIHGCPSGQNFKSSGFTVDPSFAANFQLWGTGCNTTTQCPSGPDGPMPSGLYVIPLIMGNRTGSSNTNLYTGQCQPSCGSQHSWNNNAFGGKLRDMFIDCNHVPNCWAFITGNEQEDSGMNNVRIWNTAATSGTSGCGIWAHTLTTDPVAGQNSGPSHFNADRLYCDPVATNTILGSNDYGFVMQDCNIQGGIGASGGNWGFFHSTIRGDTQQNMVTAIWTACATQPEIDHIHLEHITTDGIAVGAGGGTSNAHVSNITNVFTTSKTVHIYPGSGETLVENISGNTEITDDINSCSVNAAAPGLAFYTTDAGGEGYWNGDLRSCANVNTDTSGKLTLSGGTASYSFNATNATPPVCTATDNTSAAAVKVVSTTSALTVTGTGTDVVTYICHGKT